MRIYAAGLCAAVMAVTAIPVAPVDAATKKKQQVYTTAPTAPVNRPRARAVSYTHLTLPTIYSV